MRKKRIFREWQHPRASDGKFTRGAGSKSWIDRAEKAFKATVPAGTEASAPGRPRIGRAAKGAALFAAQREGARPSAVRAPKAATITPAPAAKNLAAFNAPDAPAAPAAKATKLPTRKPKPSTSAPQRESGFAALAEGNRLRAEQDAAKGPGTKLGGTPKLTPQERAAKLAAARADQAAAPKRESGAEALGAGSRAQLAKDAQRAINAPNVDTSRDKSQTGGVTTPTTARNPSDLKSGDRVMYAPYLSAFQRGEPEEIEITGPAERRDLGSGYGVGLSFPARNPKTGGSGRVLFREGESAQVVPAATGGAPTPIKAAATARREASLATRDGILPTDGRPDIARVAMDSPVRGDRTKRWDLASSAGRDSTMAPDIARASGGFIDGKPAYALLMNPKDGKGDYRYQIKEEGTGKILEEGSSHDANSVLAKADRIFSSQRNGGMARTEGNAVHYEARSTVRPKDTSRGDIGKGPFYDHEVVEVRKDGTERVKVKTNSASRAEAQAADMNAKEGVTPPVKAAGSSTARGRIGADAKRAAISPELSPEQRSNYDKLLGDGPASVKHRQSRQIVEQMEAHGWTLTGNAPTVGLLRFKASDGREIGVQFLVGEYSSKPRFFTGGDARGRDLSYKAALAHVVTPTHEEVGGGGIGGAMRRLGLPDLDKGRSDHTLKPLRDAQQAHTGYGTMHGPTKSTAEVAADLRKAAAQNRVTADHRKAYNDSVLGGNSVEDDSGRLLRQRADEFTSVADEMEKMDAERAAYITERDRRAALPLDIRPGRTPAKVPAKRATPKPAMQQAADRIAEQRGLPRSTKENLLAREATLNALKPKREPALRNEDNLRQGAGSAMVQNAGEGSLASRRPAGTPDPFAAKPSAPSDNLGLANEPSPTDIIRQVRALSKAVPPTVGEAGYAGMSRHTLVSLARDAKVDHRGSNGEIAARLAANDEKLKAAKAAKLNPSGVGERHPGYDKLTPAELDLILHDADISAAGKSRDEKIAALAARDKRIGVERFPAVASGDVTPAGIGSKERTEIGGGWKGGGGSARPKAEAPAAPTAPVTAAQPTYRVERDRYGSTGRTSYGLIRTNPDGTETRVGSGYDEGALIKQRRRLEAEQGPVIPSAKLEKEETKLRARLDAYRAKRADSTRKRPTQAELDVIERLQNLAPQLARSRREEALAAERVNPRGLGGMTGVDRKVLDRLIQDNLANPERADRNEATAREAVANGTVPWPVAVAALHATGDREEFRRALGLPELTNNDKVIEVDASEIRFGDVVQLGGLPAQVTTVTGTGDNRRVSGRFLDTGDMDGEEITGRVRLRRPAGGPGPKAEAAKVAAPEAPKVVKAAAPALERKGARKGDFVVVERTTSDYTIGQGSKERTDYRAAVVTSVNKDGVVQSYSTNADGSYPQPVTRGEKTFAAPAEKIDVPAAMAAAAANPWPHDPSKTGKPFDSLDEIKALVKPHLGDQTEKLKAAKAAAPKGRDPMRLQVGDRLTIPAGRRGDPGTTVEVIGEPEAFDRSKYDRGTRIKLRILDGPNAGREGFHSYKKSEKAQVLPTQAAPATSAPEALANPNLTAGIRARREASLAKLEAERRGEPAPLDTSRDNPQNGGVSNAPTTEANVPNPTKQQEPYTTGKRVEVLQVNFSKPGMPEEWVAGTVDEAQMDDNGLMDVRVRLDNPTTTGGQFAERQMVGKRGGGKRIRPVADGASTTEANVTTSAPYQPLTDATDAPRQRIEGETQFAYSIRTAPSRDAATRILEGYNLAGLRSIARDENVTVPSGATKAQLVEAVRRALYDRAANSRAIDNMVNGPRGSATPNAPAAPAAPRVRPAGPVPKATLTGAELLAQRRAAKLRGDRDAPVDFTIPYEATDVREQAKKLGASWDPQRKVWLVPTEHAGAVRAAVTDWQQRRLGGRPAAPRAVPATPAPAAPVKPRFPVPDDNAELLSRYQELADEVAQLDGDNMGGRREASIRAELVALRQAMQERGIAPAAPRRRFSRP